MSSGTGKPRRPLDPTKHRVLADRIRDGGETVASPDGDYGLAASVGPRKRCILRRREARKASETGARSSSSIIGWKYARERMGGKGGACGGRTPRRTAPSSRAASITPKGMPR